MKMQKCETRSLNISTSKKLNAIGNKEMQITQSKMQIWKYQMQMWSKNANVERLNNAWKWENFALHNSCAPDIIEITL